MGQPFLELISNLGVLALVFVFYVALRPGTGSVSPVFREVVFGIGFGAAASIVMFLPITLVPGIIFDTRGAPILLSGIFGGPVSAIVATAIASGTRLGIGGVGATVGMLSLAIYGISSVTFGAWLNRRKRPANLLEILAFGTVATIISSPVIYLLPSEIVSRIMPVAFYLLVAGNFFGVLVLGSLLNMEIRRSRLVAELRTANEQAQSGIQAKDRFIASMNHQIRTPLNSVLGEGQLALSEPLPPAARTRIGQMIESSKVLLTLVDDALAFARLSAGDLKLSPAPTDIRKLLVDVARGAAEAGRKSGTRILVRVAGDVPEQVVLDSGRLKDVLGRLLSNATRHGAGGDVTVKAFIESTSDTDPCVLTLSIADTGEGIPEELVEQVWQPFERGVGASGGVHLGTGLGLTICRQTIERMGGRISLRSATGLGTEVTIALPVAGAPHSPDAGDPLEAVFEAIACEPSEPAGRDHPPASAADVYRVLVVDDVELNAQIAAAMLRKAGFEVTTAVNGQEALEKIDGDQVDLILMDIQMPIMDGIEATRRLRQHRNDKIRATPVVALTAHGSYADRDVCLSAGMNAFLRKPVEGKELISIVRQFVA